MVGREQEVGHIWDEGAPLGLGAEGLGRELGGERVSGTDGDGGSGGSGGVGGSKEELERLWGFEVGFFLFFCSLYHFRFDSSFLREEEGC